MLLLGLHSHQSTTDTPDLDHGRDIAFDISICCLIKLVKVEQLLEVLGVEGS